MSPSYLLVASVRTFGSGVLAAVRLRQDDLVAARLVRLVRAVVHAVTPLGAEHAHPVTAGVVVLDAGQVSYSSDGRPAGLWSRQSV